MTDQHLPVADDQGFETKSPLPVMSRGLSQVMFNYLPERTFDYDRGACIGKVFELRVQEVRDVDVQRLIASIRRYVERWGDRVDDFDLTKPHLLLFARPTRVLFNLFPLSFQCNQCGRIKTFEKEQAFVKAGGVGNCVACGHGVRFEQIYHILVHECGQISGLFPRSCPKCHRMDHIALDLRGSQRARDFRWLCKMCGEVAGPVQRVCKRCVSPDAKAAGGEDKASVMMRVIPHRANQAYYAHHITVLNLPTALTAVLQGHPLRDKILAKAVVEERYDDLEDLISAAGGMVGETPPRSTDLEGLLSLVTEAERAELMKNISRLEELRKEKARRETQAVTSSTASITEGGWLEALEYLNVHTLERIDRKRLRSDIDSAHSGRGVVVDRMEEASARIGISDIQLVQNFPVVTGVFGFTRVSFEPESLLSGTRVYTRFQGFQTPFSGPVEHKRRRPIFVDDASTEALLFKLSPRAAVTWLQARGHAVPGDTRLSDQAARAWLLGELQNLDAFVTFKGVPLVTRDAFTLVHTFAHLTIRVLSKISGIERTGLAEYLFPRVASFAIYNTKAGNNLGGLNTVFAELQQELLETLESDVYVRTCVYDPVCESEWNATCHACTHLSEMSCKHFNRGLSRRILFGPSRSGSDAGFLATI